MGEFINFDPSKKGRVVKHAGGGGGGGGGNTTTKEVPASLCRLDLETNGLVLGVSDLDTMLQPQRLDPG